MSTPVKPPGHPSAAPGAGGVEPGAIEGKPGEVRELVEADPASEAAGTERAASSPALASVEADLRAGRIDANEAIERMVRHALERVPVAHRPALEAQLRAALAHDPALLALQKDLQRASQT